MPTITRSANDLLRLMIERMDRRRRMDDVPVDVPRPVEYTEYADMEFEPIAAVRSVLDFHGEADKVPDLHGLLRGYVRRELSENERETVCAHLRICEECEAYVQSLRGLTGERVVLPPVVEVPSSLTESSEWSANIRRLHRRRRLRAIAIAGSAFVVIGSGGVLWYMASAAAARDEAKRQEEYDQAIRAATGAGKKMEQKLDEMRRESEAARKQYENAQSTLNQMSVVLANMEHTGHGQSSPAPAPFKLEPYMVKAVPLRVIIPPKLVLLDGGGRITVEHDGRTTGLSALPPAMRDAITKCLKTGRAPAAVLPAGMNERTKADGLSPTSPTGTIVEWQQPTFRWQPVAGALSYHVSISDSKGEFIAGGDSQMAEWTVPVKIQRGRIYTWEVSAHTGTTQTGPTAHVLKGSAKFGILDQARLDELQKVRKTFSDYNLAVGIQCLQFGLLDNAEREFQALYEANQKSPIARKLIECVRSTRPGSR